MIFWVSCQDGYHLCDRSTALAEWFSIHNLKNEKNKKLSPGLYALAPAARMSANPLFHLSFSGFQNRKICFFKQYGNIGTALEATFVAWLVDTPLKRTSSFRKPLLMPLPMFPQPHPPPPPPYSSSNIDGSLLYRWCRHELFLFWWESHCVWCLADDTSKEIVFTSELAWWSRAFLLNLSPGEKEKSKCIAMESFRVKAKFSMTSS